MGKHLVKKLTIFSILMELGEVYNRIKYLHVKKKDTDCIK